MKAAVLHKPGELVVEEVPKPIAGPDEVVLEVEACGLCGTDLKLYEGHYTANCPVTIGHEMAGTIVETGEEVQGLKVGDNVVVDPNESCGACDWCRSGYSTYCEDMAAYGVLRDGGFAEYCRVGAKGTYLMPEGLSFKAAALTEPVSCAVHGIDRAAPELGQTAVIIGGGPMGQIHAQLVRAAGAARTILIDIFQWKLDIGLQRGASEVINAQEQDAVEAVMEMTDGQGADLVIEAVGTMATIEQAVGMLKKHGKLVIFGLSAEGAQAKIVPFDVLTRELTIVGAWVNPYTFPRALQTMLTGQVDAESLISEEVPLDNINEAMQHLAEKPEGFMKALIVP